MDIAVVILLAVALALLVALLVLLLQARSSTVESTVRAIPDQLGVSATENGGLVVMVVGESLPIFEMVPVSQESDSVLAGERPVPFDPVTLGGAGAFASALLSFLPLTNKRTIYEVVFRSGADERLRNSLALVHTASGDTATLRGAGGRFVENARIVERQLQTVSALQFLSAAAVVAVVLEQLEQIKAAVEDLGRKVDAISERLRDDDHGEIRAADRLIEQLVPLLARRRVPNQMRLELAVARRHIESIYFARQRFVERFRSRIEELQDLEEQRGKGGGRAWARGTPQEFSRREALTEEALLYARAMVCRARLAFCSAGVIGLDDDGTSALAMLRQTESELRRSFEELHGVLRELSTEKPSWSWVPFTDRREVHDTARRLAALFGDEVQPLLPRNTGSDLRFLALGPGPSPGNEVDAEVMGDQTGVLNRPGSTGGSDLTRRLSHACTSQVRPGDP